MRAKGIIQPKQSTLQVTSSKKKQSATNSRGILWANTETPKFTRPSEKENSEKEERVEKLNK